MEAVIKQIELTPLELKKGETLVVTIKSENFGERDLAAVREGFIKKFPDNDIIVFNVTPEDAVEFHKLAAEETVVAADDAIKS